jgi:hypothetical protein
VQAAVVRGDSLLHLLGQVVPQVPTVGHLDRIGGAGSRAFGVGPGAVSTDHLGAGMRAQPGGERVGLPIGEQVDRPMGVDVDQHGAVHVPAPEREIVHAQHRHGADLRVRQRADQPQQRAPARRQAQHVGQPGTRPPGQRQPDRLEHPPQQRAAPRMARGQPHDLLGERAGRTPGVLTEEPAHPQRDLHTPTGNRRVRQAALIPAVHPCRPCPAARARRLPSSRPRPDPHQPANVGDPLDHHIRQVRQQNPNATLITTPSEMIKRP